MVGLMVLIPAAKGPVESIRIATCSCGTDSPRNTCLLEKVLTTKYPLGVVLMELAFSGDRSVGSVVVDVAE